MKNTKLNEKDLMKLGFKKKANYYSRVARIGKTTEVIVMKATIESEYRDVFVRVSWAVCGNKGQRQGDFTARTFAGLRYIIKTLTC